MSDLATIDSRTQVARPLNVLVPLIRQDLKEMREAEQAAGMEFKRAAGEKMLEARGQCTATEFDGWCKRNFSIGRRQANEYMNLARHTSALDREAPLPFRSMRDVIHKTRNNPNYGKTSWHAPLREALGKVDIETLNRRAAELARAEEREASRKLALQLIDIGYKALASKLHPDKGGSRDAMARLNAVRDRLKQHV